MRKRGTKKKDGVVGLLVIGYGLFDIATQIHFHLNNSFGQALLQPPNFSTLLKNNVTRNSGFTNPVQIFLKFIADKSLFFN